MRPPPRIGFRPGQMNLARLLIHLPNFIKLYTRLWRDPRVGPLARTVLVVGLLYLLMPIDALFDLMIPLGLMDDLVVVAAALWGFVKLCPPRVVAEHVEIIDQGG